MQFIKDGYRGFGVLVDLGADFLLFAAVLAFAIGFAAFLGAF